VNHFERHLLYKLGLELSRVIEGFMLTNFPEDNVSMKIHLNGRVISRTVNVSRVINEALSYIDTHCANSPGCNSYFRTLNPTSPISLRQILDEKKLLLFCLGGKDDKDLPAGYTFDWRKDWAQIGLNLISLADSGTLASVLVHELAHVAGAPGKDEDAKSHAAEYALKFCGMVRFGYFDKDTTGALNIVSDSRVA
jgi:hypothetical protein